MSSVSGASIADYYFYKANSQYGVSDSTSVDYLFSSTTNTQTQLDSLSNSVLSRGIDQYTKKDYAGAAAEFRRSINLSPSNDNSSKAYDYLSKAYLQLDKTDEAIKNYKEAITANPTDDSFHLNLGDLYFKKGQLKDAEAEYEKAVQLNPNSADNRYSLGMIYLTSEQLKEAKEQFTKVTQLAPTNPSGFYGLGQVFRSSGQYNDAINQLNKAVAKDKTVTNTYLELGYTYTDMGNMDMAQKQLNVLQGLGASQATTLQSYMYRTANPKLTLAYSPNGFSSFSGPGTAVSDLNSDLSSPKATKYFSMTFMFSKDMDASSVQNIANWQIGRQYGAYISDTYNFGLPVPSTEVNLPMLPQTVVYDSETKSAVVTFTISQNDAGNGTIDPSHISFKFKGIDTYGKTMDPKADEYSGFSLII